MLLARTARRQQPLGVHLPDLSILPTGPTRSPEATRQLASRARRRVRGSGAFTVNDAKIVELDVLVDPDRVAQLDLGVLQR